MACSAVPPSAGPGHRPATPRFFSPLLNHRYEKEESTTLHVTMTDTAHIPDILVQELADHPTPHEADDVTIQPMPMESICPVKHSNGSQQAEELSDEQQAEELSNDYLCMDSDKFKVTGTHNQFEPSDDKNYDLQNTTENLTDIVEMEESGYYSGDFDSFPSLVDEYNDSEVLESFYEIQNSIDPKNIKPSIEECNRIGSQINQSPLTITNILNEERHFTDSVSDEEISETFDCEKQANKTFKEQYKPQENSQIIPGFAGGIKSEYNYNSTQNNVTSQTENSNYSTPNIIKHSNTNIISPKEQVNDIIHMAEYGELNNLIIPQMNITKHERIYLQMLCFSNENIKSCPSSRRGTRHLEGLQKLTMMVKQPSNLSIISDECIKLKGGIDPHVIQAAENNFIPKLHLMLKDKLDSILNAGYSFVRKYVLDIPYESGNKNITEYLLTMALESITTENLEHMIDWLVIIVHTGID